MFTSPYSLRPDSGASRGRGKGAACGLTTLKTRTQGGGGPLGDPLKSEWAFSPTGRGKGNQGTWCARGVSFEDVALLCWVLSNPFPRLAGKKRIATTPRLPFPRQAGGKGNRKRMPFSHDSRFLDRQGEKESQAHAHVPMTAFSSTSKGERESQAHPTLP